MMRNENGVTLLELMLGMAIMAIMAAAFASLLKYSSAVTVKARLAGEAQEDTRQALAKIEEALAHANEITVSSAAFVEFVCDYEKSPDYDPNGDLDGDGIPNFRDADRDADAFLLMPATAQWQTGFNLKDDDEDGDGAVDVRRRIYFTGGEIRMDTSVNQDAWGGRVTVLMKEVDSFTLTYLGSKANPLGKAIDFGADGNPGTGDDGEGDGIITGTEMDMVDAPDGMGNRNGLLDTKNERRYATTVRVALTVDRNHDGKNDYGVETDVFPALLALKSQ
ncbi:MAG: prepilin-type N-terminal cleavage/methylation domain-containing protein [Elusimicrobiota bacterium]